MDAWANIWHCDGADLEDDWNPRNLHCYEDVEVPARRPQDYLRNRGPRSRDEQAALFSLRDDRDMNWARMSLEQARVLQEMAFDSGNSDTYYERAREYVAAERAAGRME